MKSPILSPSGFDTLCRRHWLRLCALACKVGCGSHDAEDAVQEVFHGLVRRGRWLPLLDLPEDHQWVHLRLLLRSHISNSWRDSRRQKRGGHLTIVALDSADAELKKISAPSTPEDDHDRAWMADTIQRALNRLYAETSPRERRLLDVWMGGASEDDCRTDSKVSSPRQPVAHRVALHRAKVRLRRLIQLEAGAAEFSRLGLRL